MWTSDSYSCFLQKMLCLSYGLTSSMYPVGMKCINYYNNYQEFSASLLLGSGTQRRTIYLGVWLNPYSIDVFSFVEFRVTEVGVFLVGMPIGGRIFLRAEAELLCCWYVTYWFMQWNLCLGALCFTFCLVEGSTTTEIKHWVELFFGVKVIAMNSHQLPRKGRRMGPIMAHTMHYRRMIITLQPGYSIPPLRKKRT